MSNRRSNRGALFRTNIKDTPRNLPLESSTSTLFSSKDTARKLKARLLLAALIKSLDNRTNRCFWRINTKTEQLVGALGLKSETFLRDILIFCGYYNKERDRFEADELKQFCHTHVHSFRHRGCSKEWFIRLGQPTRDDPDKHRLMQSSFRSEEIASTIMEGRSMAAPFAT